MSISIENSCVTIPNHPLVKKYLTELRDEKTGFSSFRKNTTLLSQALLYEAMKDASVLEKDIHTPLQSTKGYSLEKICLVPVLRAGLGMLDGCLEILGDDARVLHYGAFRDPEALTPVTYYCKRPENCDCKTAIILDPMLATGGTALQAIEFAKDWGCQDIRFLCVLASETGINNVLKKHPDVRIYAANVDPVLNSHGYIIPGLGDAGDRLYQKNTGSG